MSIEPKAVALAKDLRDSLPDLFLPNTETEIFIQQAIPRAINYGRMTCERCAVDSAILISSTRTEPKPQPAKWPFD